MRRREGLWSFDSRDLLRSQCEHCTKLAIARELDIPGIPKLIEQFYQAPDNLAIRYGIRYEARLEKELIVSLGDLVQAPKESSMESTMELMRKHIPIIYQGSLRGGSGDVLFSGRPDFLLRGDYRFVFADSGLTAIQFEGPNDGYSAWDVKLSSTAKPDHQNQVALYLDVLLSLGMASDSEHGLILGSREVVGFDPAVLLANLNPKRQKYL